MKLYYDPEGDLLEVTFEESLKNVEQRAFRLRDGFMLFVAADSMRPIHLTIVNYRRLAELPTFLFNGWKKIKTADRKKLAPILASSAVSSFLKLDPQTGYGYVTQSDVLYMLPLAA